MPGSDGLGFLVILKKTGGWDLDLDEASWFFWPGRGQWVYGLRGAHARWLSQWVESWWWTNSQHRKIVCLSLSPRVEKSKLKEGNKSFLPEPRDPSVFRVFRIPIRVWTFYEHYEGFYTSVYLYSRVMSISLEIYLIYIYIYIYITVILSSADSHLHTCSIITTQ